MQRRRTIILGGGLAGLSAAYHLDGEAIIYDQHTSPGGLCRQVTVEGFRCDAVPHVLHFQHEATRLLVSRLLGGDLQPHARRAGVYAHGTYLRYPFQAHLFGLPRDVVEECVQGRLHAAANGGPRTDTFERWIHSTFGEGIVRHFMEPYNAKFWTVPLSELTCEWLDGLVPVPTVEQTIHGASQADASEYGYNVEFWYPRAGGLGALLDALRSRVPSLRMGKRLLRIRTADRHLSFADGEEVAYDTLLSSVPLPEMASLLDPLPSPLVPAFDRLRWTSICVVHLGIRGAPPVPWHWVYVPDREVSFYRVGIPSHYAPDAAPDGHYLLSAEIAHAPWRPLDQRAVIGQVIRDLIRLKLLRHEDDIVFQLPITLRYGYPIYDRHYAGATTMIGDYLRGCGIMPIGRFGSWRYLSIEQTLLDGQQAVAVLTGRAQSSAADFALRATEAYDGPAAAHTI
ncbi:MAG: FAD-dependent oxidoreductase [Candidatus Omnitrophica bacterium]|nr:FAD-dependent oxidoreductase [Candidatus Omnitrophota bacterium]